MKADEMPRECGIYMITRIRTGDSYIGAAVDMRSRCKAHLSLAGGGSCVIRDLVRRGAKFDCTVLEFCERSTVYDAECGWIDSQRPKLNRRNERPYKCMSITAFVRQDTTERLRIIGQQRNESLSRTIEKAIEHYLASDECSA